MDVLAMFVLVLLPVIISPAAMWRLREVAERGKPDGIFNWRTQSWAFMFGDTFSLPLAIAFALKAPGISERVIGVNGMIEHWRWYISSIVVAIIVALGFRCMDAAAYRRSGNADRLNSPTKLWHDFVVYPFVGFLMLWIVLPAVLTGTTAGWMALACFGSWLLFGVCDMIRSLNPANMHPRVRSIVW